MVPSLMEELSTDTRRGIINNPFQIKVIYEGLVYNSSHHKPFSRKLTDYKHKKFILLS